MKTISDRKYERVITIEINETELKLIRKLVGACDNRVVRHYMTTPELDQLYSELEKLAPLKDNEPNVSVNS